MRAHLLISGRVQGVGYRAFTRATSARLGLSCRVENLEDGRVEAEVVGPRTAISALIAALRRGPPLASVTSVEVIWGEGVSDSHGRA